MKKTVFNPAHHTLGARMVEFAGFEMPIEYSGILSEHMAVRNAAGMFDVSHMGEIWIKGRGALELLQRVSSNDAGSLFPGKAQYSCFPNGNGGIVDDLIVHQFDPEKYFLVVNAANIEKDWDWLKANNTNGALLENASDRICQLAVQGPAATRILQKLTRHDLSSMESFTFITGEIAGIQNVIIAATGYTGAGGFELYLENGNQPLRLWNEIMEAGKEYGLKPVGLAARDTLRLEMGYCLYGNDIDDTTSPIEAGLGWITKLQAGKDLIDKDYLQEQKRNGVKQKLVGFEMVDRGIPRQHYEIRDAEGSCIGNVTSGTLSPVLNKGIGMGYVATPWSKPGKQVYINIRNKMLLARIVKFPFISETKFL
ncbi:MAG: glycine cleavage system aminomethyltransferase GcvT [Bacteroidales bacterium]|nr:glycine cleavage system aminomethyltransferase GcvT [Bacteroidales bacterium]